MDTRQLIALVVSALVPVALRVLDHYLGTHLADTSGEAEASAPGSR